MPDAPNKAKTAEQVKALAASAARAKALVAQLTKVQAAAAAAKGELEKESDEGSSEG